MNKKKHTTAKKVSRRNLKSADSRSLATQNSVSTSMTMAIKTGAFTGAVTVASLKTAVTAALPTKAAFATAVKKTIKDFSDDELNGMKPPNGVTTLSLSDLRTSNNNITVEVTTNPAEAVSVGGATASAASAVLSVTAVFGALMA